MTKTTILKWQYGQPKGIGSAAYYNSQLQTVWNTADTQNYLAVCVQEIIGHSTTTTITKTISTTAAKLKTKLPKAKLIKTTSNTSSSNSNKKTSASTEVTLTKGFKSL